MNLISQYLTKIRRSAIVYDIKITGWKIYTIYLILFVTVLMVENVFYLSSFTRFTVWISVLSLNFIGVVWLLITARQIHTNSFERYRWSYLARKIGKNALPKEDTIINALQIERGSEESTSTELSQTFINQTIQKLNKLNFSELFPLDRIYHWKRITLVGLAITILSLSITWKHSVSSLYRWTHPKTEFIPPKPFKVKSVSRHIRVLGGENIAVSFTAIGDRPDSLQIEFKPIVFEPGRDSLILKTIYPAKGKNIFTTELKEIFQNYRYRAFYTSTNFWQPWDEISSKDYSISVTDRPTIEDFSVTIRPPAYTALAPQIQKANQAEIQALNGSRISIQLQSNQQLDKAELILNGEPQAMKVNHKNAQYHFTMKTDGEFSIHLTDSRGIRNRNPIPYKLQMIADLSPEMTIIQPPPIVELGGNQSIPIVMTIEDDFGFSNLQLAYEIQRPSYIQVEPFISS